MENPEDSKGATMSRISTKKTGKTLKGRMFCFPLPDKVQLHLIVTRSTGDTEVYAMPNAKSLTQAREFVTKVRKVKLPAFKQVRIARRA